MIAFATIDASDSHIAYEAAPGPLAAASEIPSMGGRCVAPDDLPDDPVSGHRAEPTAVAGGVGGIAHDPDRSGRERDRLARGRGSSPLGVGRFRHPREGTPASGPKSARTHGAHPLDEPTRPEFRVDDHDDLPNPGRPMTIRVSVDPESVPREERGFHAGVVHLHA